MKTLNNSTGLHHQINYKEDKIWYLACLLAYIRIYELWRVHEESGVRIEYIFYRDLHWKIGCISLTHLHSALQKFQ